MARIAFSVSFALTAFRIETTCEVATFCFTITATFWTPKLRVGREHVDAKDLLLVERLVGQAECERDVLQLLQPVDALHAEIALFAILELRPRSDREVLRPLVRVLEPPHVEERLEVVLLGIGLAYGDGVDVVERRRLGQ